MVFRKLWVYVHHFSCGLTDDDEIHNNGLLSALVIYEIDFTQPFQSYKHQSPLVLYDQGSQEVGSRSYRSRFLKHFGAELQRQVCGRQQIDVVDPLAMKPHQRLLWMRHQRS